MFPNCLVLMWSIPLTLGLPPKSPEFLLRDTDASQRQRDIGTVTTNLVSKCCTVWVQDVTLHARVRPCRPIRSTSGRSNSAQLECRIK